MGSNGCLLKDDNYLRSSVETTTNTNFYFSDCLSFYPYKDGDYYRRSVETTTTTFTYFSVYLSFCPHKDGNYNRRTAEMTTTTFTYFSVGLSFCPHKDGNYNRLTAETKNYNTKTCTYKYQELIARVIVCASAIASFITIYVYKVSLLITRTFSYKKLWNRLAGQVPVSLNGSALPINITDGHSGPLRSKPRRPHGYTTLPIHVRLDD